MQLGIKRKREGNFELNIRESSEGNVELHWNIKKRTGLTFVD